VMGEEDSKALANAGSHGIRVHFECSAPMSAEEFGRYVGTGMLEMAGDLTRQGAMIGHIKAFVRGQEGTVRLNLVDPDLGVDRVDTYGSRKVTTGSMSLMTVVVGADDCQVKEAVERYLRSLEGRLRILKVEQGGHEEDEHRLVGLE